MLRLINRLLGILAPILVLGTWLYFAPTGNCAADDSCPEPAATGRQKLPSEMIPLYNLAGIDQMGANGPDLPKIYSGYPELTKIEPYVPCILLKSVGYIESGWKQFRAAFGETGETKISGDYGYGAMQITSGMSSCTPITAFDRALVASSTQYNIGTGALFLVGKWNAVPSFIGTNSPYIVEDWYYAVWAYNGYGYINNPNNTRFNEERPPFINTSATPRSWYPYQELIWGIAANPPNLNSEGLSWTAQALTLPTRSLITSPPPTYIDRPTPSHTSCLSFEPTDYLYFPSIQH